MSKEKSFTPTRAIVVADVPGWDIETDVAIVGFGGAGACAAIEAADAGASVALFELTSASGGSTALSSAEIYMGGNGGTPIQQACGFSDTTEDMINYLLASIGPLADEEKVRAYCEGSTEHYDWLVGQGARYKESFHEPRAVMALTDDCLLYTGSEKAWPFVDVAKPCPRGHNLQVEGDNGGPLLMKILTDQVDARESINVYYDARTLCLVVDDDRAVVGIVVRMDQQEHFVRAIRGVVLCAGGFVMNQKMVAKFAPRLQLASMPIGNPGDTGTGIQMGMSVGGAAINMGEGFVSVPFYPPEDVTKGIFVNEQGQRFINEDVYHARVGDAIFKQPGQRIYLIVQAEGFKRPPYLNADIAGTGESIDELVEDLGMQDTALAETLAFYNRHAADGKDPLFHKDPKWLTPLDAPLAALDCTPGRGAIFPCFTLGGLDTLPTGEVVDARRNVIPGLYAAGRTAAGVPRTAAGYASGLSVGDATWSGRQAGKAAAKRGTE